MIEFSRLRIHSVRIVERDTLFIVWLMQDVNRDLNTMALTDFEYTDMFHKTAQKVGHCISAILSCAGKESLTIMLDHR